ncbi:MAG: tetratricopeptide repeat protein [Candidatus Neomarinimicrobiota bacterium]
MNLTVDFPMSVDRCGVVRLLFILVLGVNSAFPQGEEQVFVGSRPLGMGETFVAVADDGNTIYWNPAGLPGLRRQEITTSYTDLFGLAIINSYVGYVLPLRDEFALGLDWYYLGFDDEELGYSRNKVNFAFGFQLFQRVALGGNIKYIFNDMSLDGTSYGRSSGVGWDFGVLITPWPKLRIGLVGYDISGTSVTYDNNIEEEILSQKMRAGLAWKPREGLTIALDVDDRWHLGAEYWILEGLGIRGGVQRDRRTHKSDPPLIVPSAGIGLRYKALRFDYSFEQNPYLYPTHRFSLSFQLRPALVSITSASVLHTPLFRSLYHFYEDEEFAQVTLKNSADKDLPVKVSLYVPTMMETPHEENIVLPAKTVQEYTLGATFSDDILTSPRAPFDNLVQPEVKISYTQERQEKFAQKKMDPTYVLGRGKISWAEPERIASFVMPEDPAVDRVAKYYIGYYAPILKNYLNRSNLGRAMILFDALGSQGLSYGPDPQTPFLQISKDRSAFDTVKYPVDLLKTKVGDCDDLTVLYGSLLENLGIATRFLDVFAPGEGHIFLMFDSGVSPQSVEETFLQQSDVAIVDGRVWIPVETTLVGQPFFLAWQQGAFEYQKRKNEQTMNEIDVRRSQQTYRPGSIEGIYDTVLEEKGVSDLLKADLEQYSLMIQQIVFRQTGNLRSAEDYYDAAAIYLDFSRLSEAMEMLEDALRLRKNFPDAVNTLGVVYTKMGEYDAAIEQYNRALKLLPDHPGFKLNIAITHYLQGKKILAQQEYEEVVRLDPNFAGGLDLLLGIQERDEGGPPEEPIQFMKEISPLIVTEELETEISPPARQMWLGAEGEDVRDRAPEVEALETFRKRKAKSDNAVGLAFARRGNMEMAADFFRRAHRSDPDNTGYLVNLATAHYVLGRYDAALMEYDEIAIRNPELLPQLKFIVSKGKERAGIRLFE